VRTRVEGATRVSPSSSSNSVWLDPDNLKNCTECENIGGGQDGVPMRILSKGSVRTYLGTLQRKSPRGFAHKFALKG
jgi:hypothetical protein